MAEASKHELAGNSPMIRKVWKVGQEEGLEQTQRTIDYLKGEIDKIKE